jgi:ABC-type transport system involved in cytochrome c biogenesis permease subunit
MYWALGVISFLYITADIHDKITVGNLWLAVFVGWIAAVILTIPVLMDVIGSSTAKTDHVIWRRKP